MTFQTTRWSLIAASREPSPEARSALDQLCRAYRPAVFSYLRSRGYGRDQAEDHTQGFFAQFLERRLHEIADPARGRFRALLKSSLERYLVNTHEHDVAAKRGGGAALLDLDDVGAAAPPSESPEQAFETAWAVTVLDRAMQRLADEARSSGKAALFEQLRGFLTESPALDEYRAAGETLGMRPNTVAVAVHRLKQRLREAVRAELADTVADPDLVEEELQQLRTTLGSVR